MRRQNHIYLKNREVAFFDFGLIQNGFDDREFVLFSFFVVVCVSWLNFKCSGPITTKRRGEPRSILSSSWYHLLNISNYKGCFSLLTSLISSPLKLDVINFALFGKIKSNSVSILLAVAGSILTLVNKLSKHFF